MKKIVEVSCKNDIENGQKRTTITIESIDDPIDLADLKNMSPLDQMFANANHIVGAANQLKESYEQGEFQEDFEERYILISNEPNLKHMDWEQIRDRVRNSFEDPDVQERKDRYAGYNSII